MSLVCPIDNKLFRDTVKTPCCGTQYCEECIQTHLLERDFLCPKCGKKIASLDKLVVDKPMRTKVADYIDKVVEDSKKEGDEQTAPAESYSSTNGHVRFRNTSLRYISSDLSKASNAQEASNQEQDFYCDQQPGTDLDMSQMVVDSIPQLQAQIAQISVMLQNPTLPNQVRHATEVQHHQLQIQLQQAQTVAAALAAASSLQQQQQQAQNVGSYNLQGYQKPDLLAWTNNPFSNQQPAGQESPYQRLPLNNRRRNLKRDRPSDFFDVSGEQDKVPRYWE